MLKFTVIADTHHYSKTLGTTGRQYELRQASDQKCLGETGDIIDAAFEKLASSDTQYVLIAGDITNDGEKVSHEEFKKKLDKLSKKKKVYLITCTHDWCCDENPRRFVEDFVYNDVPVMKHEELYDYYHKYTYDDAIAVFETHLGTKSYVIQLDEKTRLLALSDDQNGKGSAGFADDHFDWIDKQLQKAKEDGCLMIGMMHHLLIPHINPLITGGGTCVGDREYVASRLADNGLKYMFCGHSHIQRTDDFTSKEGNIITEVNVGSLVGYPAPMFDVTVNEDMTLTYDVKHLDKFNNNGVEVDAVEYLKKHALNLIHKVVFCKDKGDFMERLSALGLDINTADKLYIFAKPILKIVRENNVSQIYKKLKLLHLASDIDKSWVEEHKNEKLLSFIDYMILSALDGSIKTYDRDSSYYKLVNAVVSIPSKIVRHNMDMKKLIMTADTLMTGGKHNSQHETI